MTFMSKELMDGEKIVARLKPHVKALLLPLIFLILITVLTGISLGYVYSSNSVNERWKNWLYIGTPLVALIAIIFFSVLPWLSWMSTHFAITNKRIFYRKGVFSRTGLDVPYNKLAGVEYHQSFLDRFIGVGTLEVITHGKEPVFFREIPRVKEVHKLIYSELMQAEAIQQLKQ